MAVTNDERDMEALLVQRTQELERLNHAYGQISEKVRILEKILYLFTDPTDFQHIFEEVLEMSSHAVECDAGAILLVDPEKSELFFVAARGPKAREVKQFTVPLGSGIAGACAQNREVIAVSDVARDPRFLAEISKSLGYDTRSLLAVPMIFRGEPLGVIELINKRGSDEFTTAEVDLVAQIGRYAATLLATGYRL